VLLKATSAIAPPARRPTSIPATAATAERLTKAMKATIEINSAICVEKAIAARRRKRSNPVSTAIRSLKKMLAGMAMATIVARVGVTPRRNAGCQRR
jgi:hypothetical protein